MPDPNAIISTVIRIEPPLDRPPAEMLREEPGLSVELEDGGECGSTQPIVGQLASHRSWTN